MGEIRQFHDPLRPPSRRSNSNPRATSEPPVARSAPKNDQLVLGAAAEAPATPSSATRGPAEVRKEAEALWFAASPPQPESAYRRVERDAHDVNPPPKARAFAESLRGLPVLGAFAPHDPVWRQMELNRPLVEASLGKLSEERRAQWQGVEALTVDDPMARLALQVMLIEGKLTEGPLNLDGKDLLGALHALATQPLTPLLDKERPQLVSDLVQEIAVPSAINQHNRGTCTVTSVQILMAMIRPAEYARLVAGLASPEGKVMASGKVGLVREPDFTPADGTGRSLSAKLWQPALMEYGNGTDWDYENDSGKHRLPDGSLSDSGGLSSLTGVLQAVTGEPYKFGFNPGTSSVDRLLQRIQAQLVQGRPVTVGMQWGEPDADGKIHGAHEIVVTRVQPDRVFYHNPWGIEESMPLDAFKKRLVGAELSSPTP